MAGISSLRISRWSLLLLSGDIAVMALAVPFGMLVTGWGRAEPRLFLEIFRLPLLLAAITYLLVFYIANLYDNYKDFRRRQNLSRVILSCLAGTLAVVLLFCLPSWRLVPSNLVEWQAVALVWLTVLWRFSFSAAALPRRLQRKVLIIGAGRAGREVGQAIRERPDSGFGVHGFIDDDPKKAGAVIDGVPVLGDSGQLPELIKQHPVGLAVVAITHEKSSALIGSLSRLSFQGVALTDMPCFYEFLTGKVPTDHISDIWFFLQSLNKRMLYYLHLKRLLDLVWSVLLLALTWPLMLIIALAIKLDSSGPVFYRQERLGQDAEPFQIIKFRTMVQDAESAGACWARRNDPRITRIGLVLRLLRLDELPQLYNIFRGDMSFIGPRPEREIFVREFLAPVPQLRKGRRLRDPQGAQVLCGYRERVPHYSYRLLVKPGVTGWAQVQHYYAASLEETKEKLEYDLYYIKNMGVLLDLAILLKTIRIVLFGRGR